MNDCIACGRPAATAEIESSHATSEGVVRYRRCACGRRWVELTHLVLLASGGLHPVAAAAISDLRRHTTSS